MKTINLKYDGYWREVNFSGVPTYSGLYSFHECRLNSDGTVTLIRVLYVGQADNCRERVEDHEKIPSMKRSLDSGNELCVNTAPILDPDKSRGENAIIYKHKPPFNDKLKDSFNYESTVISCTGKYRLIQRYFTVSKTQSSVLR